MIHSGTTWADAIRELTALPFSLGPSQESANFLRSAKFHRNARRLFDCGILPLASGGRSFGVVLGFVDRAIAESLELGEADGYLPGTSEFARVRLRDEASGEVLDVCIEEVGSEAA
jgi:hypothetical protein